jgi:hypothetical protein
MWSPGATVAAVAGALVVTVASGLAVAGSDEGTPAPEKPTAVATAPPPPAPPVLSSCWVPAPAGNVPMTTAQAQRLTTRAARALRVGTSAADFAREVAGTLDAAPDSASAVSRGLLGVRGAERLTCSFFRTDVEPEKLGPSGLTPRAIQARAAWTEVFGPLPAGGFARGGLATGHVDNSAHYEGRAIDVFFRPLESAAQRQKGWVFAQWLVAHAEQLHVLSVIYSDHIWTSWGSFMGFRDYQHPGGPTHNAVLRHLEHVHVAVESGRPFRRR